MIPRAEGVRGTDATRSPAKRDPVAGEARAATLDRGGRSERAGWDGRVAKTTIDEAKTDAEGEEDRAFPRDDVRTALRVARGGLGSCNDATEARSFEVSIRFEPSGRVSKVEVAP